MGEGGTMDGIVVGGNDPGQGPCQLVIEVSAEDAARIHLGAAVTLFWEE